MQTLPGNWLSWNQGCTWVNITFLKCILIQVGTSTCRQSIVAGFIHQKKRQTVLIQMTLANNVLVGWIPFHIVLLSHCYICRREISLWCCITVIVLHCQQNGPLVCWTDSRSEVISQSAWKQTLQASHKGGHHRIFVWCRSIRCTLKIRHIKGTQDASAPCTRHSLNDQRTNSSNRTERLSKMQVLCLTINQITSAV